jgi:hypothetical protein
MKNTIRNLLVLAVLVVGTSILAHASPENASTVDGLPVFQAETKKESTFKLQRINVLAGAFVELDLVVAELKVLPYVELRFNRKK